MERRPVSGACLVLIEVVGLQGSGSESARRSRERQLLGMSSLGSGLSAFQVSFARAMVSGRGHQPTWMDGVLRPAA